VNASVVAVIAKEMEVNMEKTTTPITKTLSRISGCIDPRWVNRSSHEEEDRYKGE
jgi:hypothetical protein